MQLGAPMQRGLSLYLDLLRFALALTVMLGHASDPAYVGGSLTLAVMPHYGLTSVMGFFVLSGFVIAHVTQSNERDPRTYFVARAARMYSVVLPALLLTAVLDTLGSRIDPSAYLHGPIHIGAHQPLRYLLTTLFVQDYWLWPREMTPGINHPFWSLSYEVTYYVIFGLTLTRAPLAAAVGIGLLISLAGPKIAALLPIWLLGVLTYHAVRRMRLPPSVAAALMVGSWIGLGLTGSWLRGADDPPNRYAVDYMEAGLFAINMIAANGLAPVLERLLGPFSGAVRWLGMLTFALYLCHRPLLYFFAALPLGRPGSWIQIVWLFGMTLLVIVAIAYVGEWLRHWLRSRLANTALQKTRGMKAAQAR
jgi:peptidoglycan/LPS O-acetylase OafA/YrhL